MFSCQSAPATATEFVIGTTIEIMSGPQSAPAARATSGLLSAGMMAAGVVPTTQLPTGPPINPVIPKPASLRSAVIMSKPVRAVVCVFTT